MELFHAGNVSLSEIVRQRECERYVINNRLCIKSQDTEKLFFFKKVVNQIQWIVSSKSNNASLDELFEKQYKREWFDIQYAYDSCISKEMQLAYRLYNAFMEEEFEVIATSVPFTINFSHMDWRGIRFSGISDNVDFVVKKDGVVHLIKVVRSMPYSDKARKEENKPFNSIELTVMKAAFIGQYPDCVCELWSYKSSKDTGTEISDFSKNRVSYDFKGFESKNALISKLFDIMAIPVSKKECSDCRHCSYCDLKSVRIEEEKESLKAPAGPEKKYTDSQLEVIEHLDGPMVVMAVPGAGKTACLVERCKRMIKEDNINPHNILLVSFTKKAVMELKDRLSADLDEIPQVLTLNALGSDILVKNAGLLGRRYKLAEDTDCKAMIEQILPTVPRIEGMSYDGITSKFGLVSTLYKWFNEIDEQGENIFRANHTNKDCDNILLCYEAYKIRYEKEGYISYDKQISLANELFEKYPRVPAMMSKIYRYIMVDEYQDVNEAQVRLIDAIAQNHNNIVVVGDDDQAIYSWRGGSNEFMLNFHKRFSCCRKVIMADNFRSTDKILQACQGLIAYNNGSRVEKTFVSHRNGVNKPCVFRNFDERNLPAVIAQANRAGFNNGDIAIIARKNKTLAKISDELTSSGIHCTSPKDYLVKDAMFVAIHDILTLSQGIFSDLSVYRLFKLMGIPDEFMAREKEYKSEGLYKQLLEEGLIYGLDVTAENDRLWKSFDPSYEPQDVIEREFGRPMKIAACAIYNAIKSSSSRRVQTVLPQIAVSLFGEGANLHPAVRELLDNANEKAIADTVSLLNAMEEMEKYSDEKRVGYSVSTESVNLLTAHDSKGKEFPFVIVYGLEEFDDDEEGIRLLFVAMSRAKKSLFVTESPLVNSKLLPKIEERMIVR